MGVEVVELAGDPSEIAAIAADLRLEGGLRATHHRQGEGGTGLVAILEGVREESAVATQALERRRPVVWAAAPDIDVLHRFIASGGRAFAPGRIAHSEAGQVFLEALRNDGFGTILSLFIAVRGARAHAGSAAAFGALLWDAISFADDCLNEPIVDLHAAGGALFSAEGAPDSAAIIARAVGGAIVTMDMSLCLPAMLPAAGPAEVEAEAVGNWETLRAAPFARSVQFRGDDRASDLFWGETAGPTIIVAAAKALRCNKAPEADNRAIVRRIALVRAAMRSLATGEGVSLEKGGRA